MLWNQGMYHLHLGELHPRMGQGDMWCPPTSARLFKCNWHCGFYFNLAFLLVAMFVWKPEVKSTTSGTMEKGCQDSSKYPSDHHLRCMQHLQARWSSSSFGCEEGCGGGCHQLQADSPSTLLIIIWDVCSICRPDDHLQALDVKKKVEEGASSSRQILPRPFWSSSEMVQHLQARMIVLNLWIWRRRRRSQSLFVFLRAVWSDFGQPLDCCTLSKQTTQVAQRWLSLTNHSWILTNWAATWQPMQFWKLLAVSDVCIAFLYYILLQSVRPTVLIPLRLEPFVCTCSTVTIGSLLVLNFLFPLRQPDPEDEKTALDEFLVTLLG